MDTLRRDLGNLLKILGALLVAGLGAWIAVATSYSESNWSVIPKLCASAMLIAGAAGSIFFLWQKTLRIKVDTVERSLEAGPVGPGEAEKKA